MAEIEFAKIAKTVHKAKIAEITQIVEVKDTARTAEIAEIAEIAKIAKIAIKIVVCFLQAKTLMELYIPITSYLFSRHILVLNTYLNKP
jgi:hypothetical protein